MNSVWKSITPSSAWPTLALETEAFFNYFFRCKIFILHKIFLITYF